MTGYIGYRVEIGAALEELREPRASEFLWGEGKDAGLFAALFECGVRGEVLTDCEFYTASRIKP